MTVSIPLIVNLLVFFIPAAALILPHGIGIGTALLALTSIFVFAVDRRFPELHRMEKGLLKAFGLFSAVALFSILWSGDRLTEFETPSRFALAIFVYLLLRRFPPSKDAFWFGMAAGAIGGGVFAI